MPNKSPNLLWADDGARRFRYERLMLRRAGWSTEWAIDARDAAHALSETPFDILVLDQMLPYDHVSESEQIASRPWGGCLLLYWLRGRQLPGHAPAVSDYSSLHGVQPLTVNRSLPVVVVSAYYDEEIAETMRNTSSLEAPLRFFPKPVDIQEVLAVLETVRSEQ